jgi:hypothetical protein
MSGPVSHEAQEGNLREWCNAPSANELWSQIWSNQFKLYINSNSTTIKGEARKREQQEAAIEDREQAQPFKII